MHKHLIYLAIVFGVTATCSCTPDSDRAQQPSKMNTIYPSNTVITQLTYPYRMSDLDKSSILRNLALLSIGDEYSTVVRVMGPPYIQKEISAKEHGRILGIRLVYYIEKNDSGVNEKLDKSITFEFDLTLRLKSMSSNVPEATLKFSDDKSLGQE